MNRKALLGKALLEVVAEFAVFATLLFVAAGTLLWPAGWVSMALFFGLSRPGGQAARAEGTERGNYRPLPVRQAPYVYSSIFEHVLVLPGARTAAGLVVGSAALPGSSGSSGLEDHPRRWDARERTGRIPGLRAERDVPTHPSRLVTTHPTPSKSSYPKLGAAHARSDKRSATIGLRRSPCRCGTHRGPYKVTFGTRQRKGARRSWAGRISCS